MLGMRLAPAEAGAAERARASRAPVCIDDALNDDRVSPETIGALRHPLDARRAAAHATRRLRGAGLHVSRERTVCFTPDIVDFAKRVASTVSLALDNARLYEEKRSRRGRPPVGDPHAARIARRYRLRARVPLRQ